MVGNEEDAVASLWVGVTPEGPRTLSSLRADDVSRGQLKLDMLVLDPCRSGFLEPQKREMKSDMGGASSPAELLGLH